MKLLQKKHKWVVQGEGEGWIFNYVFPTKWKASIGMEVFEKGGGVKDYWIAARNHPKREVNAQRVIQGLEPALKEMEELEPTPEEIQEYGKDIGYGVVTYTQNMHYFPPKLHDTWGIKRGGRIHIDIGSDGVHLMLDKFSAWDFIDFIKDKRQMQNRNTNSNKSQK